MIRETTITYDNIQNVSVRQGPVQRLFSIADVVVETAGGGTSAGHGEGATVAGHHGLLEGIDNAEEVRNLILAKWRNSTCTGLGDDAPQLARASGNRVNPVAAEFSMAEISLLEQIRDLAVKLADSPAR